MLFQYIFFIFKNVLNFLFTKEKESPPPIYTFTTGRRIRPSSVQRRHKILKKQQKEEEEEDPFEKDKKNLLKHMEEFYYVYGTFVNTYAGSAVKVAFAWNDEIWEPMRQIKSFINTCELLQFYISPSPSPSPFSSPSPSPSPSPEPLRRARRPYRPFQDLPATSEEDKCKICMINKKVIGFFPCAHVGTCNLCCKYIYNVYFKISNKDNKPCLSLTLPEPPKLNIHDDDSEDEEEFINNTILELSQPRFHHSKKCVFCKEKIENFKIIYSI
jgi:hypothetical protein